MKAKGSYAKTLGVCQAGWGMGLFLDKAVDPQYKVWYYTLEWRSL